jgi:serine/threonine protein kinase
LTIEERGKVLKRFRASPGSGVEDVDLGEESADGMKADTGPPPPGPLSAEEAQDFDDILRSMLKYIPEERAALEELLAHPWLKKEYEDDVTGPVIEHYSGGIVLEIRHPDGAVEKLT